uniref:Uncharacterized protein n=1 Tax=Thermorudis sp. TaxID=1969470 RepID=A0A7C3AQM8_9BACT
MTAHRDPWDIEDEAAEDEDALAPMAPTVGPAWRSARRTAIHAIAPSVERLLRAWREVVWPRAREEREWALRADLEVGSWRIYRHVGSQGSRAHEYLEFGITATVDERGEVRGFVVDDGQAFLLVESDDLAHVRDALAELHRQRPQPKRYESALFAHGAGSGEGRESGVLARLVRIVRP